MSNTSRDGLQVLVESYLDWNIALLKSKKQQWFYLKRAPRLWEKTISWSGTSHDVMCVYNWDYKKGDGSLSVIYPPRQSSWDWCWQSSGIMYTPAPGIFLIPITGWQCLKAKHQCIMGRHSWRRHVHWGRSLTPFAYKPNSSTAFSVIFFLILWRNKSHQKLVFGLYKHEALSCLERVIATEWKVAWCCWWDFCCFLLWCAAGVIYFFWEIELSLSFFLPLLWCGMIELCQPVPLHTLTALFTEATC